MSSFPKTIGLIFFALLSIPLLFGGGKSEESPTITMGDQPRIVMAPGNPDAVVKNLILPFSTVAFGAKGQGIKSWTFLVFDSSGKRVFQETRLESRDRGFFGEMFNIGDRPQVEVPKELEWDGTYNLKDSPEIGNLVPDGNYTYQISLVDTSGGTTQTPPFNVTVKNTKILVDYIRTLNTVFSPAGQRPSLLFEQSGSREFRWEGLFTNDAGEIVRSYVWENKTDNLSLEISPPSFSWDGKDKDGKILPEGQYFYTLNGTNRSGAKAQEKYSVPLTISIKKGELGLSSDLNLFSPRAEGIQNIINFIPEIGVSNGLQAWTLRVSTQSAPKTILWSRSGKIPLPTSVAFDGKNVIGQILPEGQYMAVLTANYENGDTLESNQLTFKLDQTAPRAELTASAEVFGGSSRPTVKIDFRGTPGIPWSIEITGPSGKSVSKYSAGDSGEASIEMNGQDGAGIALPDGTYTVRASAKTLSGIPGFKILNIQKDSRVLQTDLDFSTQVLVPGKSQKSTVRITPILGVVDSIEKTTLTIQNSEGTFVDEKTASGILPFWDWQGLDSSSTPFADGKYQVNLQVLYSNGGLTSAQKELVIDSHFLIDQSPEVEMKLSTKVFVPGNIDGPTELTIMIKAKEVGAPLESWQLTILDPRGKTFRQFTGRGAPPANLVWNGKSDKGELVESGEDYQILLRVTDREKRETRKQDSVAIDILVTMLSEGKYKIVISSIHFAGYSSDIFKASSDLLSKNFFVLRRLSTVLNKFPGYKIRLEGYAVSVYWNDLKTGAEEQKNQLLPLSLERAEEVRAALTLLGVDGERFSVQGFGGDKPMVPNSDLENRWKNRRVEFYLEKL